MVCKVQNRQYWSRGMWLGMRKHRHEWVNCSLEFLVATIPRVSFWLKCFYPAVVPNHSCCILPRNTMGLIMIFASNWSTQKPPCSQSAFLSIISRSYFAAICWVKMMMTVFKKIFKKNPTQLCVYHHRSETVPRRLCQAGSGADGVTDTCGCEHDSLARKLEVTCPAARTLQQSGELKQWNECQKDSPLMWRRNLLSVEGGGGGVTKVLRVCGEAIAAVTGAPLVSAGLWPLVRSWLLVAAPPSAFAGAEIKDVTFDIPAAVAWHRMSLWCGDMVDQAV